MIPAAKLLLSPSIDAKASTGAHPADSDPSNSLHSVAGAPLRPCAVGFDESSDDWISSRTARLPITTMLRPGSVPAII